jgi:hypothetical protein
MLKASSEWFTTEESKEGGKKIKGEWAMQKVSLYTIIQKL